jgi:hypothetical protein
MTFDRRVAWIAITSALIASMGRAALTIMADTPTGTCPIGNWLSRFA